LDGLFTHFRLAGILDQIAGLVLGHFTYKDEGEPERIQETLRREAERIGVPCLAMAQIGHGIDQITVPVGAEALLYTSQQSLSLVTNSSALHL
jgi:muramoyltetrapeptide carboxypeptidase